jgi:hypothetical protein
MNVNSYIYIHIIASFKPVCSPQRRHRRAETCTSTFECVCFLRVALVVLMQIQNSTEVTGLYKHS